MSICLSCKQVCHASKQVAATRRAIVVFCLWWLCRQHLVKDPGHVQAAFWLAAVTPGPQVAACPPEIVSKLFDAYADKFDDHLTGSLGYKTPGMLM